MLDDILRGGLNPADRGATLEHGDARARASLAAGRFRDSVLEMLATGRSLSLTQGGGWGQASSATDSSGLASVPWL